MSSLPTAPDEQIARLVDDGYDMVLEGATLSYAGCPTSGPRGCERDGRLVLPVNYTEGVVTDATDHRIWWIGEQPCDEFGAVASWAVAAVPRHRTPDLVERLS